MLSVPVNENQNVTVTFDVTGGGEDIICYYIREVKIKMNTCNSKYIEELKAGITKTLHELPFHEIVYTELNNEQLWTVRSRRFNGFSCLAFFQPAIEMQHHELTQVFKNIFDTDKYPIQMEMVLDVIY